MRLYHPPVSPVHVGQEFELTESDRTWFRALGLVATAVGGAGVYHGYKRGGVLPALGYGALGFFLPIVGAPVMIAQGFGKRK